MKHNKLSIFERAPEECPNTCGECRNFRDGICTAYGGRDITFAFSDPKDRPLPMPLMCPWWYINRVWEHVYDDEEAIAEIQEVRLHQFVMWVMIHELDGAERMAFLGHMHRPDGSRLIDFKKYPDAKDLYNRVRSLDGRA